MIAVDFKGSNQEIAKEQEQYRTLPAHFSYTAQGRVTTLWRLSIWERVRLIFGGGIWLQVLTYCNPLQPLRMSIEKPEILGDVLGTNLPIEIEGGANG